MNDAQADYSTDLGGLINEGCEIVHDAAATEALARNAPDGCVTPANFIIALAPDPVHTHLALQFDRTMEVIQEALQDEHYLFVRALMPWDPKSHRESDDHTERIESQWYEDGKADEPGLMVFRGGKEASEKVLFVFVVGESPTDGIRQKQFRNAIQQMQTMIQQSGDPTFQLDREHWHWKPGDVGLRILGPSSSGSLASLAELLNCGGDPKEEKLQPCYPLVSIHSGTASSRSAIDDFVSKEQELHAHFVSFQESDSVMIERFMEYLVGKSYGERHYDARQIALLSEDETAYGAIGNTGKVQHLDKACGDEKDDEVARTNFDCKLTLYFPREISQLRAAYQKDVASSGAENNGPRDILPFYAEAPGSDDDTVAPFSAKQVPLSQEAVLLSIVSELKKHNVQYTIIRASDPLDALFLVRYLRGAYPQGRVVTLGADLLFRREAEDPRLHGLLSLATYSMAPSASHGFASYEENHVERIFPSSFDAGTYNALRSLITSWATDAPASSEDRHQLSPHSILDRTPSGSNQPKPIYLYQYGWRCDVERDWQCGVYDAPPVRLLALGRDDYWPVANLGPYNGEPLNTRLPRVAMPLPPTLEPITIPKSWRAMQIVGLGLALGYCLILWRSSVLSTVQPFASFAPAEPDARCKVLFVSGLTLTLISLILAWPSLHGAQAEGIDYVLRAATGLVCGITVLELLIREGWHLDDTKVRLSNSGYKGWVRIALLIVAFVVLWIGALRPEDPVETSALIRRFATLRALHLTSGLSFIMPVFFFLSAWLWWANHAAAGYALLDPRRPQLPAGMKQSDLLGVEEKNLPELQSALNPGWLEYRKYLLVLVGAGVGVWLLVDHAHPVMSLERPFLENATIVFLALALAGVLGLTMRLWDIWLGVRKLLVALDSLPLRSAFVTIGGFSWKPIWKLGAGSLGEFQRILAREREALALAMKTAPHLEWPAAELERTLQNTMRYYRISKSYKSPFFRDWLARRRAELRLIRRFGKYQAAVATAAGCALDYLAKNWPEQKEERKRRRDPETYEELCTRACERFVCLAYVTFLVVILVRIRTLIVAIGGMYVLILIGTSQYPFEPKAAIQLLLVILLGYIITIVGLVFAQIHRDATLSNITDTNPGELGADFWIRMASFVALPLLSLFASQFPPVNKFFYSWLQPAIESLNR